MAIESVLKDDLYITNATEQIVLRSYIRGLMKLINDLTTLTYGECEVLDRIAEGKSTKEISLELRVSVSTVEAHRKRIMDKLNLYSIAELTKYAIRDGPTNAEG